MAECGGQVAASDTVFEQIHPMKKMTRLTGIIAAALIGGLAASAQAEVKAGDMAPDFSLKGSDGKTYKLSDFRGKQAVVIAWYPKAFTGG